MNTHKTLQQSFNAQNPPTDAREARMDTLLDEMVTSCNRYIDAEQVSKEAAIYQVLTVLILPVCTLIELIKMIRPKSNPRKFFVDELDAKLAQHSENRPN